MKVHRPRVDVRLDYHAQAHGQAPKRLIVLHQTISPDAPGVRDLTAVGGYLAHVGYAIHVIIDRDGNSAAVDPAHEADVYWHVQGANEPGMGIEQVSFKTGDPRYWWARTRQLHKTARWCAYLCHQHHIPPVYDPHARLGICGHADVTRAHAIAGGHTDCQWPNYPTRLVARLAANYLKAGWR